MRYFVLTICDEDVKAARVFDTKSAAEDYINTEESINAGLNLIYELYEGTLMEMF